MLLITVGAKIIQTLLHIIEGNIIQYNILLGCPWIREMQCVPSTYHGCLKYIYKDKVHCVFKDPDPYSHCNLIFDPNKVTLPSPNLSTILMSKNMDQSEVMQGKNYIVIQDKDTWEKVAKTLDKKHGASSSK